MNTPLAVQISNVVVDGVRKYRLMVDWEDMGWRGYDLEGFETYALVLNRMYDQQVFSYKGISFKCDSPWKSEPRSGSFIFRAKLYQQIL